MSVRRLHPEQPATFAFTPENQVWAEKRIGLYPKGREASAVIPLLWRAQEQSGGWLPEAAIRTVAKMLDITTIRALEVATFYTQFQLSPMGDKAHIQVCGTTPCQLRGAGKLLGLCRKHIASKPFTRSADGTLSWEEVECLGACVNAPMVLVSKDTYEDLDEESFITLINGLRADNPPKPGPQVNRQFSAPQGGKTCLDDPTLFDGSRAKQTPPGLAGLKAKV